MRLVCTKARFLDNQRRSSAAKCPSTRRCLCDREHGGQSPKVRGRGRRLCTRMAPVRLYMPAWAPYVFFPCTGLEGRHISRWAARDSSPLGVGFLGRPVPHLSNLPEILEAILPSVYSPIHSPVHPSSYLSVCTDSRWLPATNSPSHDPLIILHPPPTYHPSMHPLTYWTPIQPAIHLATHPTPTCPSI